MPRPLQYVHALIGLFVTITYALFVSIPIWPFAVLPRGRREQYTMRWGGRLFAWLNLHGLLFVRSTVVGKENLPNSGGYLVVSNHRSWTDVPLLMLHTLSQGISKKEVAYVPFFGINGYLTGAVFFDRKKRDARAAVIRDALAMMRSGARLHLFPEGTRTRDGRINPKVHLRLVEAAWKDGIDCLPACVWDTQNVLPVGSFRVNPLQRCGLEIGPVVPRADFTDGAAYADAVWGRVKAMAREHHADEPFLREP